jgi:diguanylate cyclase (GGDEF)-like protein
VVDSLEKEAYSNSTLKALQSFAQVVGQLTYRSYMDFEHLYQREQYKALLEYQKKFLHTMSVKDIFQHIESFICRTVPSDRLMIIIKEGDKGRIVRCNGINQSFYQDLEFSIEGKGLLSLCFLKNMEMQRSLRIGERVFRVSSDELYSDNFRSLAGIPVLNENGDAEIVLSVESQSLPIYSTHYLDLLRNIANVAGFALARVNAYEEKQNLASKDGLTGLYNHRTFQGILNQETIRARRMGSQLGIIMMDIDRFKSVNDTYGHPIGDQVLKNNANTILKEIRGEVDVLCRYGGEEFVVLIIDANEQIVKDTAERIRVAVQSQDVEIGRQEPLKITLSLGYALFPDHGDDFKIVLDKADKALYKAKTGGRNKVVGYK